MGLVGRSYVSITFVELKGEQTVKLNYLVPIVKKKLHIWCLGYDKPFIITTVFFSILATIC